MHRPLARAAHPPTLNTHPLIWARLDPDEHLRKSVTMATDGLKDQGGKVADAADATAAGAAAAADGERSAGGGRLDRTRPIR